MTMKGQFNTGIVATDSALRFALSTEIAALRGVVCNFTVVDSFRYSKKDGSLSDKAYNALQPVNPTTGQPLIEGFALTKWDLAPTPRISRDTAGNLVQVAVTSNRLYATAAKHAKVPGVTEKAWLQAIANELNGSVVEPFEYIAVKKDGGTYANVLFGVK